jgi:DNA-binding MarR family transcriptional regulator
MAPGSATATLDELTFLVTVAAHPNVASVRIYRAAGLPDTRGRNTRNSLLVKNLIVKKERTAGRKIDRLSITPAGRRLLGQLGAEQKKVESLPLCQLGKMEGGNPECIHYWNIEPPSKPTSLGVCMYCGGKKIFLNDPPYPWPEDSILQEKVELVYT